MVDVSRPVTNPELKRALEEMRRENTRESQERAVEELMKANLLAPVVIDPVPEKGDAQGRTQLKKDTKIQFQMLSTQDGRAFFPAFTDWEELCKLCGQGEQQTLIMTFDDYAPMLLRDSAAAGLVVNPFGDSLTLEKPMVEYLAARKQGGLRREEIKKDTRVMLGQPAQWPEKLVQALKEHVAGTPEIRRMWLRLMVREDGKQSYLLVVDHEGDMQEVFGAIARATQAQADRMPVDMVPYGPGLGETAAKDAEPFYER